MSGPPSAAAALTGRLFGHGPGTGESVEVELAPTGFVAHAAGRVLELPFRSSRLSYGGSDDEKLVIEWADPSGTLVLYLDRTAVLPRLRRLGRPELEAGLDALERRLKRGRRRSRLVLVLVLAGLAGLAWLIVQGVGAGVRWGLSKVPTDWEVQLGRSLLDSMHADSSVVKDPAVVGAVETVFQRLLPAAGDTGYEWRVRVIRNPAVNAFALPGGSVAVYTGLIEKCRTPEELAGVLAHEIQHVVLRHGLERIGQALKWQLALALVIGDLGSVQNIVLGQGVELVSLAHGREAEREADARGLELLLAAGVDPEGMTAFFDLLKGEQGMAGKIPTFLSTHPGSADRAERLRAEIARRGRGEARGFALDWAAVQQRIKEGSRP